MSEIYIMIQAPAENIVSIKSANMNETCSYYFDCQKAEVGILMYYCYKESRTSSNLKLKWEFISNKNTFATCYAGVVLISSIWSFLACEKGAAVPICPGCKLKG